jgi:hypothetical protein
LVPPRPLGRAARRAAAASTHGTLPVDVSVVPPVDPADGLAAEGLAGEPAPGAIPDPIPNPIPNPIPDAEDRR